MLYKILPSYVKDNYSMRRKQAKIKSYMRLFPSILEHVRQKDKINVVFFVANIAMWKNDDLFRLLLASSRFSPYIVSFLYDHHDDVYRKARQEELHKYFTSKGFPYIDSYNFDRSEWFDVKSLEPDIIFYAQPYNCGKKEYLIENFWNVSLFAYIPYCIDMENINATHNTLLENIAWKLFYPTKYHQKLTEESCFNKGRNVAVVGYPSADSLNCKVSITNVAWKDRSKKLKKIIWAPHHSILESDTLQYSNFLTLAHDMLCLAERYSDKIQIAFKPHPILKVKLYGLLDWGQKRTDEYYEKWENGINTFVADGEYMDLFLSSDALIHDCSTFMAEYLYVCKPVLFMMKDNYTMPLNEFGNACLDCHYKGKTIEDIEYFIDKVLIDDGDFMLEKRITFLNENLLSPKGESVAETIYSIMCDEFIG